MQYRVHMHTPASPGSTFYCGHVDVEADDAEQAIERAKRDACRKAGHRGLKVDRVEILYARSRR